MSPPSCFVIVRAHFLRSALRSASPTIFTCSSYTVSGVKTGFSHAGFGFDLGFVVVGFFLASAMVAAKMDAESSSERLLSDRACFGVDDFACCWLRCSSLGLPHVGHVAESSPEHTDDGVDDARLSPMAAPLCTHQRAASISHPFVPNVATHSQIMRVVDLFVSGLHTPPPIDPFNLNDVGSRHRLEWEGFHAVHSRREHKSKLASTATPRRCASGRLTCRTRQLC